MVMKDILKNYAMVLVPSFALPIAMYIFDSSADPAALFRLGLVFVLFILANEGLAARFPKENLVGRSTANLLEQNLLMGALFGAAMTLFNGTLGLLPQDNLVSSLRLFATSGLFFGLAMFVTSLITRKQLQKAGKTG
jgi:hypothetical protein